MVMAKLQHAGNVGDLQALFIVEFIVNSATS